MRSSGELWFDRPIASNRSRKISQTIAIVTRARSPRVSPSTSHNESVRKQSTRSPSVSISQPLTIEQIVHQILAIGKIAPMDRQLLILALSNPLTERENQLVAHLHRALRVGKVVVV